MIFFSLTAILMSGRGMVTFRMRVLVIRSPAFPLLRRHVGGIIQIHRFASAGPFR